MCVVSAVGDYYGNNFPQQWPNRPWDTNPNWIVPPFQNPPQFPAAIQSPDISNAELLEKMTLLQKQFDEIKAAVAEMKNILLVAAEYDRKNNEPHCEMDEKVEVLKKIAKWVDIDLSEVFDKE